MNTYFVNADPYYTPKISISPFNLKSEISIKSEIDSDILKILGTNLVFTYSGKHAIRIALEALKIQKTNTIGIVTTSGNAYVSKCVTETISEYCEWVMYDHTQMIDCLIVIHEFGFLLDLNSMNDLRRLNIPIINDFAYSFLSLYLSKRKDFLNEINFTSFPKSFNVNYGGIIHLPGTKTYSDEQKIAKNILEALKNQINVIAIEENISQRKRNREFYRVNLIRYGYNVIWNSEEICPGVCMIEPLKQKDQHFQKLQSYSKHNQVLFWT